MELRLERARATKDIDLVLRATRVGTKDGQDQAIRCLLQDAVQNDHGDFFEFIVEKPTINLEAIPYGGFRFPIEASLGGRLFVRFPIDIVVSSLILMPIEHIASKDWLGFAGIEHVTFPAISKEQQFAEKFHAYTLPRKKSENSRVKDMLDLTLLIETGRLKMDILKIAIKEVFECRATHQIPQSINPPPSTWEPKFNQMAKECGLACNVSQAFERVKAFISMAGI